MQSLPNPRDPRPLTSRGLQQTHTNGHHDPYDPYLTIGLGAQYDNLQAVSEGSRPHDAEVGGFFNSHEYNSHDDALFENFPWPQLMPESPYSSSLSGNFSAQQISSNWADTEPSISSNGARFDPRGIPIHQNSLQPSSLGEPSAGDYDVWWHDPPRSNLSQPCSFDAVGRPTNELRGSHGRLSLESCPSLINEPWFNSPPDMGLIHEDQQYSVGSPPNPFDCNGLVVRNTDGSFRSSLESPTTLLGLDLPAVHTDLGGKDIASTWPYMDFTIYSPSTFPDDNAINNGEPQPFDRNGCGDLDVQWPAPQSGDGTQYAGQEMQHLAEQSMPEPSAPLIPLNELSNVKQANQSATELSKARDTLHFHDCFVYEDGLGAQVSSELHHRKGARFGHLAPEKKKVIAMRRKAGNTCLRCRICRIECDGGSPCGRCVKAAERAPPRNPCMKAQFTEIIESGTCNYISQRAINHFTLDESRRVQMSLPPEFDVNQLLGLLESRRHKHHIRARQASDSLYVLDLAKCYDFLDKVRRKHTGVKRDDLRNFIDNTLVKTDKWFACVRECNPAKNKTALLSKWNNMPSRASYDIVSLDDGVPDRPLDPENDEDKKEILIAAQVSRIMCRKLEIDGYKELQKYINNIREKSAEEKLKFAQELGKILVSLRWRMSWWELLGDGSKEYDPFRDKFVERVKMLSKALYFYYFAAIKIGSWNDMTELEGVTSSYPDASLVFDEFPTVRSIQGFEEWLERGKALIRKANAQNRFSK